MLIHEIVIVLVYPVPRTARQFFLTPTFDLRGKQSVCKKMFNNKILKKVITKVLVKYMKIRDDFLTFPNDMLFSLLEQRINQTIEFSALACKYIIITLFMPGAE
jgi:hypothetical protein